MKIQFTDYNDYKLTTSVSNDLYVALRDSTKFTVFNGTDTEVCKFKLDLSSETKQEYTLKITGVNGKIVKIPVTEEVVESILPSYLTEIIDSTGRVMFISSEGCFPIKEEPKEFAPKVVTTDESDIIRKKLYCNVYNNAIKKSSKFIAVNEAEFAVAKFDRFFSEK